MGSQGLNFQDIDLGPNGKLQLTSKYDLQQIIKIQEL